MRMAHVSVAVPCPLQTVMCGNTKITTILCSTRNFPSDVVLTEGVVCQEGAGPSAAGDVVWRRGWRGRGVAGEGEASGLVAVVPHHPRPGGEVATPNLRSRG